MRRRLRRCGPVAALAALGLVAAGCGIPADGEVEAVLGDNGELVDGTTTTSTPTTIAEDGDIVPVALYFVGPDNALELVIREFPDGTSRDDVLAALEAGPLPEEAELLAVDPLQTELPAGLEARFGSLDTERASQVVNINPEAGLRLIVDEQPVRGRVIITQIVCTALSLDLDGATGIEIDDGAEEGPIPLSDINAEPLQRPANREDFNDCRTGGDEREEIEAEAEAEAEAEVQATSTTTTTINDDSPTVDG